MTEKRKPLKSYIVPNTSSAKLFSLYWEKGKVWSHWRPIVAWRIELREDEDDPIWVSAISIETESSNERRFVVYDGEYIEPMLAWYPSRELAEKEFVKDMKKEEKKKRGA